MQYFKGDATELKMVASGTEIMDLYSAQKDEFFDGAYACSVLGELLYDNALAPLANAIDRTIFIDLFSTIFDAFVSAGTFESYISVFKNIFGDDVLVDFTVPAAGRLQIGIEATGVLLATRLARIIESGVYVYYERLDSDNNTRMASIPKGFQTQYEAEQMLFELVPGGIFTEISLTITP